MGMCFNIRVGRFYYTNNATTNITCHIGFEAILGAPLTNVVLFSCAVDVTLLPNVKVSILVPAAFKDFTMLRAIVLLAPGKSVSKSL